MEMSEFPLTAGEKTAEDSEAVKQSGVGTSTATESKELIVSTPDDEKSAV
jgi:hypothetical protein